MARSEQAWVRSQLDYDLATGVFRWRVARKGRPHGYIPAGTQAGSVYPNGYRVITIDGERYLAARLAVLWMLGHWPSPPYEVDHKNRNRSDDRWSNLRLGTRHQNQGNKINRNNRLGVKGVCWEADRQRYKAYIEVDGRSIHLGRFKTIEEAKAAYAAAATLYFGEFARMEDT